MTKLKAGIVISETATFPFYAFLPLLRGCWPIFAAVGLVSALGVPWVGAQITENLESIKPYYSGLYNVLMSVVIGLESTTVLAAGIRLAVLGQGIRDKRVEMHFGQSEINCALGAIIFGVFSVGFLVLFILAGSQYQQIFSVSSMPWTVGIPVMIVCVAILTVVSRFALLPAIGAMGSVPDPRAAWRMTKGMTMPFLIIAIVGSLGALAFFFLFGTVLLLALKFLYGNIEFEFMLGQKALIFIPIGLLQHYLIVCFAAGFAGSLYRHIQLESKVDD